MLLIKAYVINPYRIPSSSMEPTLHCAQPGQGCEADWNDRVIANRFVYHFRDPERGEIVVFDGGDKTLQACAAGGTYVKRIVGLPGETVAQENGVVYLDGEPLDEPYLEAGRGGGEDFAPVTLGPDEYWVMGDNRALSCDSRRFGFITRDEIIGPVFFVYWPLNRIGFR